jgi:hypothetical protein
MPMRKKAWSANDRVEASNLHRPITSFFRWARCYTKLFVVCNNDQQYGSKHKPLVSLYVPVSAPPVLITPGGKLPRLIIILLKTRGKVSCPNQAGVWH